MGESKVSGQELIKKVFSPTIAVLASHDAETICQKNNLSFCELMKPFLKISQDVQFRDPNNISITVRNLSLNLVDCNASPPQRVEKLLNDSVSASLTVEPATASISTGMYELSYQANTPWFDAYRDCYLANIPPSEHEFLGHCLGCVMAVSSSHPDPLDCFAKLTKQQQMLQQQVNRQPRWLCPEVLRYYVLLHDSLEGDQQRADTTLTAMRSTYGAAACHLLLINSRPAHRSDGSTAAETPAPPDPWAQHLLPSRQLPHQHQFLVQQHTEASSPDAATSALPQHPLDYGWSSTDSGDVSGADGGGGGSGTAFGHGAWLSADDHNRLRVMVLELVNRALMPWVEKTLKLLNEQIASRMRGKGFLGGAKKWFSVGSGGGSGGSGSKGGSAGQQQLSSSAQMSGAGAPGASSVVYASDAPELQLRRYADLAFLFQQYEVAHQAYQQLKKDFQADAAYLHYAGTMEMAALSAFMQEGTSQRNYPHPFMDNAIATYLHNCKNQLLATRGTFLSAEALKTKKMFAEAAVQYIKMTTEDSDLRSALLLEQAAHCYLRMRLPHVRKFAFHLILAGHRFSKASQRAHSLRCYRAALRVYRDRGWTLAEDHINLVLTKHSAALRELESAKDSAYRLLRHDSRQSPAQQSAFLRDFVHVYREFIPSVASPPDYSLIGGALPVLPLPKVLEQELKLLLSRPSSQLDDLSVPARGVHFQDADLCHPDWASLERALVEAASGRAAPSSFRPALPCLSRDTPNENSPVAIAGEPLTYQIPLRNPAQIPLIMRDVCLLWSLRRSDGGGEPSSDSAASGGLITNEVEASQMHFARDAVTTEQLAELSLLPGERKCAELALIPKRVGHLRVTGLAFTLCCQAPLDASAYSGVGGGGSGSGSQGVRGKVPLEVTGPRLNRKREDWQSVVYAPDRRLELQVAPPMPSLQLCFIGFPTYLLAGQVRRLSMKVTNCGQVPLTGLRLASRQLANFTFGFDEFSDNLLDAAVFQEVQQAAASTDAVESIRLRATPQVVPVPVSVPGQVPGVLQPGHSATVTCWLRAAAEPATQQIAMLFYYESTEPATAASGQQQQLLRHRVLRHSATLEVLPGLAAGCCLHAAHSHALPASQLISLTLTNTRAAAAQTGSEIVITQVSCISRRYRLVPIGDPSVASASSVSLQPGETYNLCLGLAEAADTPTAVSNNSTETRLLSRVQLDGSRRLAVVESGSPVADMLVAGESADLADCDAPASLLVFWQLTAPATGTGGRDRGFFQLPVLLTQSDASSAAAAAAVVAAAAAVAGDDMNTGGSMMLMSQRLLLPNALPPGVDQLVRQCKMVRMAMQYEATVTHNFGVKRLCLLPVSVHLCSNCQTDLLVRLDARETPATASSSQQQQQQQTQQQTQQQQQHRQLSSGYAWVGFSGKTLNLPAGSRRSVKLCAAFSSPGVYDLQTLTLRSAQLSATGDPVFVRHEAANLSAARYLVQVASG